MGWKSTRDLTRREAISAILSALDNTSYEEMSNEQLSDMMYGMGFGDNPELQYYGNNFSIYDTEEQLEESNKYLNEYGN